MAAPRIRGIPPVGNDVPKALVPILGAMRENVQLLVGDSSFAAVRYANFLDLLKKHIGSVQPPARGGGDDYSLIADPYFQELKKQTEQALADIAGMFANASLSEMLVRQNLGYIDSVHQDLLAQADEVAQQALDLAQQAQGLLNLATELDALQTVVDHPTTGLLAQSTLLSATISRVDANQDSIDVLTALVTSLESEIVDVAALDPAIMWQFESSTDGWTSNASLTPHSAYVTIGAAANSHFTSPAGIVINGALFPRIVARIRRTSGTGWLGRATYATTGAGAHGFDPANFHLTLAQEPVFAGGGWVIVTWNMELLTAGGNDWVTHIIDQIRLELSNDASTVYEVDWVALARIAPSYVTATVNALESRVTQAENEIDALSAAVTSLGTSVDDLAGDVSANTGAISTLSARLTTAEGEIDANSASIILLDSRVNAAEAGIAGHSTAISGLTTRMATAENSITSHASRLTSLDSRLNLAEPTIAGHSTAISGLQASVSSINGTVTSHSSDLVALDSRLDAAELSLAADASAISALNTRVTTAEGRISSHALQLTSLDARLDNAEAGLSGQAIAITNLDARVSQTESGIASSAASVTMLQVYGRDANRINPLTSQGNATDWDFGGSNVVAINIGNRNTVAGRIRTGGNVARYSKYLDIDPRGIYEVRMSALKNRSHGSLYFGISTSSDATSDTTSALPVRNGAVVGGASGNPYWAYAGAHQADGAPYAANQWYDFVFYLLGAEADAALCPAARVNDAPVQGSIWSMQADGWRLSAGQRFVRLRVLNYYNAVSTDAYFNNFSITRLDNQQTAALAQEASVRATADGLLNAQWTLKLDVGGYVAGFGLAVVNGANGALSSSFNVLVDRFAIALPGVSGPKPVFVVGDINGTPTIGINGNLVVDGTIVYRHLLDGAASVSDFDYKDITTSLAEGAETTIATAKITTIAGKPVSINAAFEWALACGIPYNRAPSATFRIRRNGVQLYSKAKGGVFTQQEFYRYIIDEPGAGTHTYTITAQMNTFPSENSGVHVRQIYYRALEARQLKR